MLLTPYGWRQWLTITIVAAILAVGASAIGWWWLSIPVAIAWGALLSFFRDPPRSLPAGLTQGDLVAPADGVVSAILMVDGHETTDGPAVIIRIFLSVLNVHVNRAPCDATVEAIRYQPGQFLNAQTEESARVNEYNLVTLRTTDGVRIGLRQVSGMIARHIVCRLKVGQRVARGERFGMIKFGSTAEVILPNPDQVRVHVQVGQKVRGMKTLLATRPVHGVA